MRRLFALAALLVVALGGAPTHVLAAPDPRGDPGQSQPGALIWGNGVFSTREGIARWLAAHEGTYASWARLHPAARAILATAASLPVSFRSSQLAPTTSPPPELPPLAAGAHSGWGFVYAFLGVLAAVLLAAALLPLRRLAHRFPLAGEVAEARLICAVAGLSIAVGIAAAKLAG